MRAVKDAAALTGGSRAATGDTQPMSFGSSTGAGKSTVDLDKK
jgi:hypothetical protein